MLSYKRITFTLKRYVETLNNNDNKRKPQCSLSRVKPNVNQLWLLLHIYIIQQPKLSVSKNLHSKSKQETTIFVPLIHCQRV